MSKGGQRYSDRFIQLSPLLTEPGWYAKLREGKVIGPFSTRDAAQIAIFNLVGIAPEVSDKMLVNIEEASINYSHDSRRS